jgi:hypothetical protein
LFGFLEELNHIDCKSINEVAKEMSVELTGSLANEGLTEANDAQTLSINSMTDVDNIKNILRDVEEILESSIQQKVKMTRYIDKLLKQKNREYAELQSRKADSE